MRVRVRDRISMRPVFDRESPITEMQRNMYREDEDPDESRGERSSTGEGGSRDTEQAGKELQNEGLRMIREGQEEMARFKAANARKWGLRDSAADRRRAADQATLDDRSSSPMQRFQAAVRLKWGMS